MNVDRAMRGSAPSSSSGAPYGMKSESAMTGWIPPPVACTESPETLRARPSRGARPVIARDCPPGARRGASPNSATCASVGRRRGLREHLQRLRQDRVSRSVPQPALDDRPGPREVVRREADAGLVVVGAGVVWSQLLRLLETGERHRIAVRRLRGLARDPQ